MYLNKQELDQWIAQKDQEAEKEIKSVLHKISAETVSAISLKSVKVHEVTPIEDYWSKIMKELVVSPTKANIIIAQNEEKAHMEVEIISEWLEKPQKESEEDQPFVLMNPPPGEKKTLVLREIPEDEVRKLLSNKESLAACDVAIFVHDRYLILSSTVE
ncbi:hypothetical protein Scep_029553 [Stephania cephalantha]|uniref:Uncharacterized protein n=1 Tax=Stephania cephalantha TaxID=152367 RepID=A0AAP0HFQ4_9MAGN